MPNRPSKADLERYGRHVLAEWDAAELYRNLAQLTDGRRREVLEELAGIEEKHAAFWVGKIREHGGTPPAYDDFAPSQRTRDLLEKARRHSIDLVLPIVEQDERAAVDDYTDEPAAPASMLADEAEHARALQALMSESVSPMQVTAGGEELAKSGVDKSGTLRAAIFGVNDGLVSNTALVMGFAGAAVGRDVVLLAGLAGWLAGAFSMGSGEYISMVNQREAFEREIEFERMEIEMHPEEEERELQLIYEAKGIDTETAKEVARQVMADPEVALETMAREELGLDPDDLGNPWGAAVWSFLSFSAGALAIVVPYFFTGGGLALGLAVGIALVALATVGGVMARVNGRPVLRGILRQLFVGVLAAGATYLFGMLFDVTVI